MAPSSSGLSPPFLIKKPTKSPRLILSRLPFPIYRAIHCATSGKVLNDCELENLPFAGALITLEIGMRFLTDYLMGDVYFKTKRPNQNLDRCRTQFKLVESIEAQMNKMQALL